MPSSSSQSASGIVARICTEPWTWMTPNMARVPVMMMSGPATSPEYGHAPWHQLGSVHEVAEQQAVADADHEAWAEQERPVLDVGTRVGDRAERRVASCGGVLPRGHHGDHAHDPDQDECALHNADGDVADRADFIGPLEQREHDRGGPDVGDDQEQLEERSQNDARVVTPAAM